MPEKFSITPESKVAALLEHYPELEDVLIGMAPPFKKLKNPILRRSVAKITSLRQAAVVGRISIDELVNRLRAAVGQEPITIEVAVDADTYYSVQPAWFDSDRVVASVDGSKVDPNVMPLNPLMRRASKLTEGEIVELVTNYLPAPAIDIMRKKGFLTWSREQGEVTRTYFSKQVSR